MLIYVSKKEASESVRRLRLSQGLCVAAVKNVFSPATGKGGGRGVFCGASGGAFLLHA